MGDRFRVGKPPWYFAKPPRPTQLPTLLGSRNEYQPKHGDALRLGSKGSYGSFHLWICMGGWQVKLCDPSLTRAVAECLREELLVINYYYYYIHLTAFFQGNLGKPAPER